MDSAAAVGGIYPALNISHNLDDVLGDVDSVHSSVNSLQSTVNIMLNASQPGESAAATLSSRLSVRASTPRPSPLLPSFTSVF
jgi:tetrahydromethanopterin S-methyltransferase subunit B